MPVVSMMVNGKPVSADVEPRTLLVEFLRTHLGLTGTHVGCDTSQCGCCTVHVDGIALKSCTALAISLNGSAVTTIEGLAVDGAGGIDVVSGTGATVLGGTVNLAEAANTDGLAHVDVAGDGGSADVEPLQTEMLI